MQILRSAQDDKDYAECPGRPGCSQPSGDRFARIDAAAGAGFLDHDFAQQGKRGTKLLPDPAGQVFAGGVLQAFDFVEAAVTPASAANFGQSQTTSRT